MKFSVIFPNISTTISINPAIKLDQCRFIFSHTGGTVNPANKLTYPEVRGIEVFCHLDKEPGPTRELLEPLETALYLVEEIMTGLVATTQKECFLAKPITCIYENKRYVLEDSYWREEWPPDSIIQGGEAYIDDLGFLDEPKNFHPMYHFYRVCKDESNSKDYRALNAWRFLEALHGKRDRKLVEYLINQEKLDQKIIEDFYKNIRCAVSHASLLAKDITTDKVIIPRAIETEFDGSLFLDLGSIIKYLDKKVAGLRPLPNNTMR